MWGGVVLLQAPGYYLLIRRHDRLGKRFRLVGVGSGTSTMARAQEGCLWPVAGASFMMPGKQMLVGFATVLLTIAVEARGKSPSVRIAVVRQFCSDC